MRRLGLVLASLVVSACGGGGGGGDDGPVVFDAFQPASVVIGQGGFLVGDTLPNRGFGAAGDTISEPHGRSALADGILYVPDSQNNRVLGFLGVPTSDGVIADFVLGQVDFQGAAGGTTASTLRSPTDCWTDAGRLFVADAANQRVLIWNSLPTSNVPADVVVGQDGFLSSTEGTSAATLRIPRSVAVAGGRMVVADLDNNRVLVWDHVPTRNGDPASVVLGQAGFAAGLEQPTSRTSLLGPLGVWTDGTRVVVADSRNDRVLIWRTFPTVNGQAADVVLGQADFVANGSTLSASGMSRPSSVFVQGDQLFVADTGFARVLVWNDFPTENGRAADQVVGQSDFGHGTANDSDQDDSEDVASASTFRFPDGVFVTGHLLFTTDPENNRVVIHAGR